MIAYSHSPFAYDVHNVSLGVTLKHEIDSLVIPSAEFPGYEIVYKMYSPGIITYDYHRKSEQVAVEESTETECESSDAENGAASLVGWSAIGIGLLMILDDIPTSGAGVADDPEAVSLIISGVTELGVIR